MRDEEEEMLVDVVGNEPSDADGFDDIPTNEVDDEVIELKVSKEIFLFLKFFFRNFIQMTADQSDGTDNSTRQEQVDAMREKVRLAKEEVESVLLKKGDIGKRTVEAQRWKDGTQTAVKALEIEALKFRLLALQSPEPDVAEKAQQDFLDAEEKVRLFSTELQRWTVELGSLQEEGKTLDEDLESANDSLFGAQQVLDILVSQLKC